MFETDEDLAEHEEETRELERRAKAIQNPFQFPFPVERDSLTASPTTQQRELCLKSLSDLHISVSDDEDDDEVACLCPPTLNPFMNSPPGGDLPLLSSPITDDYRVSHEIIGEGESGKVMACYRVAEGGKFALKVLRDCPKARTEAQLHYLTHEHENIVSIADMYENSFHGVKCLLIVVEFLEGGDLLTQFENQGSRPYSEHKVGSIMRQIGRAVEYLHELNIAHRDIKLENILCSSKGEDCVYKLGDFGFAKRPDRNTLMESPCCTPFYAPPEVICRERYNKSCDMWSLGVAMYILLSGYPPFYSMKGLQMSPGMKSRISQGYYAFPHQEWDIISDSTKEIVKSLLKTIPRERLTIHDFMATPLITGDASDTVSAEMEDTVCAVPELTIPRSVRFLKEGIKAPRLHSIQEEVGRCLVREEGVSVFPPLLERRKSVNPAAAPGIAA